MSEQQKFNIMGISAKVIDACRKLEINPMNSHNLSYMRIDAFYRISLLKKNCIDDVYLKIKI